LSLVSGRHRVSVGRVTGDRRFNMDAQGKKKCGGNGHTGNRPKKVRRG